LLIDYAPCAVSCKQRQERYSHMECIVVEYEGASRAVGHNPLSRAVEHEVVSGTVEYEGASG